ncbi:GNAT family N-acetyltransferase [Methylobacterium sp. Leaf123]|uniref:GNAT family N-acetyltransferase n=1 Tax=Methylobacterium sp. Leaf123 TaxID=1736264 RepID=UPI0009EA9738|nr:GNAT family N-acetyltransferase [Methylobacterium sp. Leaf123]
MAGTFPSSASADRVTVRRYAEADLDAVIAIFQSAIRETASVDYDGAQIEAWSRVDRTAWATQAQRGQRLIAWIGPEAAGFADLEPCGRLAMLYVHPAHGGRGVAKALLRTAEAAAIARGLTGLRTEASLTARPFFAAHGFETIEEETVTRNGQTFRRHRMRKDGLGATPRRAPDR